jgi:hypothetical protein
MNKNRRGAMSILPSLLIAVFFLGCANAGDDFDADAERVEGGITVDPCSLLTKEQITEELLLAVSPSQRESWTTSKFTITESPVVMGESRVCNYAFASRQAVGSTPAWQSDFSVTVSPANLVLVPQHERLPVPDGPGMFRLASAEGVYYVLKSGHAATIGNFPGRSEGDADAGRIALLRRIADRLP